MTQECLLGAPDDRVTGQPLEPVRLRTVIERFLPETNGISGLSHDLPHRLRRKNGFANDDARLSTGSSFADPEREHQQRGEALGFEQTVGQPGVYQPAHDGRIEEAVVAYAGLGQRVAHERVEVSTEKLA